MTVTLFVTDPLEVVTVAVICEVPVVTPVTTPLVLTVATLVVPDVHATCDVRFFVELSANVPVAVNCTVEPDVTVGFEGVIAIEFNACEFTITFPLEFTPSCEAVIVEFPAATAVTSPLVLTVATEFDDEVQVADPDTSDVSPFTVVPEALNCFVSPIARKMDVGVTVIEFNALPDTKKLSQLDKASADATTAIMIAQEIIGRRDKPMLHLTREFYQTQLLWRPFSKR